jgi:hypothetical protein
MTMTNSKFQPQILNMDHDYHDRVCFPENAGEIRTGDSIMKICGWSQKAA